MFKRNIFKFYKTIFLLISITFFNFSCGKSNDFRNLTLASTKLLKKLPFKEDDIIFASEPLKDYKTATPTSSLLKIPKNHKIALGGILILKELNLVQTKV